jgi:hypothetical protein
MRVERRSPAEMCTRLTVAGRRTLGHSVDAKLRPAGDREEGPVRGAGDGLDGVREAQLLHMSR